MAPEEKKKAEAEISKGTASQPGINPQPRGQRCNSTLHLACRGIDVLL